MKNAKTHSPDALTLAYAKAKNAAQAACSKAWKAPDDDRLAALAQAAIERLEMARKAMKLAALAQE